MYKVIHLLEKSLGFLLTILKGMLAFSLEGDVGFQTFQNVWVEKVPMEMQLIHRTQASHPGHTDKVFVVGLTSRGELIVPCYFDIKKCMQLK